MTLESLQPLKDSNIRDICDENQGRNGETLELEMPLISMLSARSFEYQKILQFKKNLPIKVESSRIQERYDRKYLQL